jgi:hypothetical protein
VVRNPFAILLLAVPLLAQSDEFRVYTDAPRLLLTPQRLRLLQRERQRDSLRWNVLDALISGGASLPEPGFAWALYYRTTGVVSWGAKAVDWALSANATDLRQLALVYDWCGPAMSAGQSTSLAAKLQRGLSSTGANLDVSQQRSRVFAAIALADRLPDRGESVLKPIIEQWWRTDVAKKLRAGTPAIPREQTYALMELLHAVRDSLNVDLREGAPDYFKALPTDHLEGHYPAPYPAPENQYHIPIYVRDGEPDLNDAALSRAAEFAMVAYDSNALENQYLQGWLIQDRFLMRGGFGIPYEFLWANPYQPGLSYFHMPLVYHDELTGHFFARTSWDEDATWLGYFDGHLQVFRDGKIESLKAGAVTEPVHVGEAVILSALAKDATRFRADSEAVFVLNLAPHARYDVEIDDQELREAGTDSGGTLVIALPEGIETGIRMKRRAD